MKRSVSADRAAPPPRIEPWSNVRPARPTLARASSYDVHCGCQFFGTDSLLPERRAMMLAGRPLGHLPPFSASSSPAGSCTLVPNRPGVVRSAATVLRSASAAPRDHEYEPVSPRGPPQVLVSAPYDRYEPELGMAPRREGSAESHDLRKRERKFFHDDSLDDEMTYIRRPMRDPELRENEEAIGYDDHENREYRGHSPASTTESRTDMELNTSQVDSSALEDLPLSREARRKQKLEKAEDQGPGAAARSLQSIRNQAGRLRAKMKAMKRPKINLPDRPKFSLPDRPRFNLPDRPKFNLPERPKFKMPERPKFNLPERPKFNLPERPKFSLPDRPKFNFPDTSKFNFTLPRARKILGERNQQEGDESSGHVDTPMVETPSKRSYFDFRNTYPRIFDRKSRARRTLDISAPIQLQPRHVTPPTMRYEDEDEEMDEEPIKPNLPPRRKGSQGSSKRWGSKLSDLEYMDEEQIIELRKNGNLPFDDEDEDLELQQLKKELSRQHSGESDLECSESLSCFRDKDFGYALTFVPGNNQAMEIVQRRQQQVLEQQRAPTMDEEDVSLPGSDQEVAHSSGSSSDRRRAGVLEEISSDEFFLREKGVSQDDVNVERYLTHEIRESFRPSENAVEKISLHEAELARSYRGTPERVSPSSKSRPPRRTRAAPKPPPRPSTPPPKTTTLPPRPSTPQAAPTQEAAPENQDDRKVTKGDTTWYFNTFPPNKPTRNRRRELRKKSSTINRKATVPQAPQRKSKRTHSEFVLDTTSQWSVEPDQEWLKDLESHIEPKQVEKQPSEPDYIIPELGTPAAPKRGRKQSVQSRKTDDDARSYISYVSKTSEYQEEPGYAYVIKPGVISYDPPQATPPPRRSKTNTLKGQYPTAARRKRGRPLSGTGTNGHFFTMPHRRAPPVRPQRNYATLGPARPPRRVRRASLEDVRNESLQSGAVIQKMKERPLPPPPRPPRKDRSQDDLDARSDITACDEVTPKIEDMDIIRSPLMETMPVHEAKEVTPTTEHVLHANLTVSNAEVVVKQEEFQKEKSDPAFAPTEEKPIHVEAVTIELETQQSAVASEMSQSQSVSAEPEVAQETEEPQIAIAPEPVEPAVVVASEPVEPVVIRSPAPIEPEIVKAPEPVVELTLEPVALPEEVPSQPEEECIRTTYSEKLVTPPPEEIIIETIVTEITSGILEQAPVLPEPVKIPETPQEKEVCAALSQSFETFAPLPPRVEPTYSNIPQSEPMVSAVSAYVSESSPVVTEVRNVSQVLLIEASQVTEEIPSASVQSQTSFETVSADIGTETQAQAQPVCDITVSTQTDPLPEDELIDDMVVTETEVYTQAAQITPAASEPPVPSVADISPAARALLEAINSGQLRLDLLDVASLRVSDLQADRMLVSNIDGMSMNVHDLQSQGGSLTLGSVQAPMDALAEALLAAAQRMLPPPPPPQIIHVPAAPPPHSDMQCQTSPKPSPKHTPKSTPPQVSVDQEQPVEPTAEETEVNQARAESVARSLSPMPPPSLPVFTTEQVLALQAAAMSTMVRSRSRERSTTPTTSRPHYSHDAPPPPPAYYYQQRQQNDVDPGIVELGNRLARACCAATMSALRRVVAYSELQAESLEQETRTRSGLQMALCVVLVIVAGIILVASLGGGEAPVHKHHWDFYMPQ